MGEVWSALVIPSAGRHDFYTGNDQSYDPELERAEYRGEAEVRYGQLIQQMSQPVIAAVDGYAIGSGNILAIPATLPWQRPDPGLGRPGRGWAAQPKATTWPCWRLGLVRSERGRLDAVPREVTPIHEYMPEYVTSEGSRERRMAFI